MNMKIYNKINTYLVDIVIDEMVLQVEIGMIHQNICYLKKKKHQL